MSTTLPDREKADDEYDLTEEQEAELEDRIAEIERGEFVDWDEVREAFLRRNR